TMFQKWVKNFDGSEDPYDHLASFKKVVRAEQVNDWHVQFEGFGLTLKRKALSLFQTLPVGHYGKLSRLEEDLIADFAKTGMKNTSLGQINSFKQLPSESVRDCVNQIRQYIMRCPEDMLPSQEWLVSIYIEGLINKELKD